MATLALEQLEIAGKRFIGPTAMQIVGTVNLQCPRCGMIGKYKFMPRTWYLTCKNTNCKQRYVIGLRLTINDSLDGPHCLLPPVDYAMPERWSSGEPAVIVIDQSDQP